VDDALQEFDGSAGEDVEVVEAVRVGHADRWEVIGDLTRSIRLQSAKES
jgi:hypothetical protein